MPQKTIREIPANPLLQDTRKRKKNLRVAAYCRVSTEEEEQQSSFEIQVEYYTNKINSHDNWKLVKIFADYGISGVQVKKRTQFLEKCSIKFRKKSQEEKANTLSLRNILKSTGENSPVNMRCPNGWYVETAAVITGE